MLNILPKPLQRYFYKKQIINLFLDDPISCKKLDKVDKTIHSETIRNYKLTYITYQNLFFVIVHTYCKDGNLTYIELYLNDEKITKLFEVEMVND